MKHSTKTWVSEDNLIITESGWVWYCRCWCAPCTRSEFPSAHRRCSEESSLRWWQGHASFCSDQRWFPPAFRTGVAVCTAEARYHSAQNFFSFTCIDVWWWIFSFTSINADLGMNFAKLGDLTWRCGLGFRCWQAKCHALATEKWCWRSPTKITWAWGWSSSSVSSPLSSLDRHSSATSRSVTLRANHVPSNFTGCLFILKFSVDSSLNLSSEGCGCCHQIVIGLVIGMIVAASVHYTDCSSGTCVNLR